jgi:hypothetical protein
MRRLSEEYPMSVLHEERQLSAEHRRALKLLADAGELGCTSANSFNHGFSVGLFADLVARARYRASRNREGGLPNDQGGSHPDYRRRPAGAGRMTKPVVATH